MPDPVISVRGLRRRYGQVVAVDDLDLDVGQGEIVALLGPNGAGKTTAVEILEGYRRRDSGEVRVLGVDPARADRLWRTRVGIVPQEVSDLGLLTVSEALNQFAHYYPGAVDPDELIGVLGLTAKRDTRTANLSGGQRRRLDVALGLVGRPEVLFLDEPTVGLDPQARRHVWDMIASLRSSGTTVLLTTHYLEEAEALADRAGVIVEGRLVSLAPPAELGGRASRAARVHWVDAAGHAHEELTATPTRLVLTLAGATGPTGALGGGTPGRPGPDDGSWQPVELTELTVTRPTLEDVYLELISSSAHRGGGEDGGSAGGAPHDAAAAQRAGATDGARAAPWGTTPQVGAAAAGRAAALPSWWRLGVTRGRIELVQFFRDRDTVVFSFFFPVILLLVFGLAFAGVSLPGDVSWGQYFLPGMVASGIAYVGFQSLAIDLVVEREAGTLKRLEGTPLPKASYFLGKGLVVVVSYLAQLALLLIIGVALFDVTVPTGGDWVRLGWLSLLGLVAFTLAGIAYSAVPHSARSAGGATIPVVLVLQFISGVFFAWTDLPAWMQQVAAIFPVKWLAQGMRGVFLPEQFATIEITGSWEFGRTALVLAAWAVLAGLLAWRFFRWRRRGDD